MIVGQKGGYLAALVSLVLTSTIVMYFVLCTFFFSVLEVALVEIIRNDP